MTLNATVHSTWDDGSPETLRDEDGGIWRVVGDAMDGTLAVEEICQHGGGPAIPSFQNAESIRPGIAEWDAERADGLDISIVYDVGENHTDGKRYDLGNGVVLVATRHEWQQDEETADA